MPATEKRGFSRRLWQQLKKLPEAFFVPTKVRWKLPENRAQFFLERENARSKEICQRHFNFMQFFHVSDETRVFDAKEKIFRRSPRASADSSSVVAANRKIRWFQWN